MSTVSDIKAMLMKGKAKDVEALVTKALAEKTGAAVILNEGLLAGMGEIGEKFKKNEVYVPEVLIAARGHEGRMAILKPKLPGSQGQGRGVVVIGTVKGDLHDIGKNLVGMMLEGGGFQVSTPASMSLPRSSSNWPRPDNAQFDRLPRPSWTRPP